MKQPLTLSSELVPVAYAEALLGLAEELGAPRQELFRAAQVRPELLGNPSGRLSLIAFQHLALAALRRCDEPALGLLLGQRLNVSTHGILGYAVLSSASLGKALQFVLKYYRVLGLAFELEVVEHECSLELRAVESFPLGPLTYFAAEGLLSSIHTVACFLLGEVPRGLAVGFTQTEPDHVARYIEVFGVRPEFDQASLWLRLPRRYLDRPMALANPATVQMCTQQCEALLASLDVADPLLTRLRRLLLARPGEFPDLDVAAQALHTSGRSLRRHLAQMGTSYQQVLDDVRRRLAVQYLTTTQLPLYEIAPLLGFSDASNFRRAFKRWTGKLPVDYRTEER